MTTRTEQKTRRGAPVRGAVPTTGAKTGQRRPEPPHPAKPVPQPRTDTARRRSRADDPLARPSSPRTDATTRRATGARGRRGAADVRDRAAGAKTGAAGVRDRAAGAGTGVREERGKAGVRDRAASGVSASRTVTDPPRTRPGVRKARPEAGRPEQPRQRRAAATGRPARRQRAPFVLLVVGLLCGGLVTLLLLNTVLAQDSMTASNLVDEISTARQQNEDLQRKIEEEKLPGRVAERAEDLGMHRDWNEVNSYDSSSQAGPAR